MWVQLVSFLLLKHPHWSNGKMKYTLPAMNSHTQPFWSFTLISQTHIDVDVIKHKEHKPKLFILPQNNVTIGWFVPWKSNAAPMSKRTSLDIKVSYTWIQSHAQDNRETWRIYSYNRSWYIYPEVVSDNCLLVGMSPCVPLGWRRKLSQICCCVDFCSTLPSYCRRKGWV